MRIFDRPPDTLLPFCACRWSLAISLFFYLSAHHATPLSLPGLPASGCPLVFGVFIFLCIKFFLNLHVSPFNLITFFFRWCMLVLTIEVFPLFDLGILVNEPLCCNHAVNSCSCDCKGLLWQGRGAMHLQLMGLILLVFIFSVCVCCLLINYISNNDIV